MNVFVYPRRHHPPHRRRALEGRGVRVINGLRRHDHRQAR